MTGTQPPGNYSSWSCQMPCAVHILWRWHQLEEFLLQLFIPTCHGSLPPHCALSGIAEWSSLKITLQRRKETSFGFAARLISQYSWTDTAKEVANCLAEMATSASCSGDKPEPAYHITAPQCPLTEVLPLHLQHSFLFCPTCPMGITDILLSGSWCKPRLWLGEVLNSEILNAIGFVPAHRTAVRFTGSAHWSQSCLFFDFSAHSLWAEREIDLVQL